VSASQFDPYNAILRRYPESRYREYLEGGNTYTTTIYVLVSAITNISRETKLPADLKLYRGLSGKSFPASFHKSDDKGRKGMLEWGFMSSTADKSTAIRYCGVSQAKPVSTILEFNSGAVDRGAVITHLSQYPGNSRIPRFALAALIMYCLALLHEMLNYDWTDLELICSQGRRSASLLHAQFWCQLAECCAAVRGQGGGRGESNGDCGAGEVVVEGVGLGLRGDADGEIILDFHCRSPRQRSRGL
jgi:hypothetical protein